MRRASNTSRETLYSFAGFHLQFQIPGPWLEKYWFQKTKINYSTQCICPPVIFKSRCKRGYKSRPLAYILQYGIETQNNSKVCLWISLTVRCSHRFDHFSILIPFRKIITNDFMTYVLRTSRNITGSVVKHWILLSHSSEMLKWVPKNSTCYSVTIMECYTCIWLGLDSSNWHSLINTIKIYTYF